MLGSKAIHWIVDVHLGPEFVESISPNIRVWIALVQQEAAKNEESADFVSIHAVHNIEHARPSSFVASFETSTEPIPTGDCPRSSIPGIGTDATRGLLIPAH